MSDTLSLQEWVNHQRRLLAEFEQHWHQGRHTRPGVFSHSLDAVSWDKAFAAFAESRPAACISTGTAPQPPAAD